MIRKNTNYARVRGRLASGATYHHTSAGKNYYELQVKVERLSKTCDYIPVIIPESMLIQTENNIGRLVYVTGCSWRGTLRRPILEPRIWGIWFMIMISLNQSIRGQSSFGPN